MRSPCCLAVALLCIPACQPKEAPTPPGQQWSSASSAPVIVGPDDIGDPPTESADSAPPSQAANPFEDPAAWDELAKNGEPWVFMVLRKINSMPVEGADQAEPMGEYSFSLVVCADGKVSEVLPEGGDATQAQRDKIEAALLGMSLPALPDAWAEKLGEQCLPLAHVFRWNNSSVR